MHLFTENPVRVWVLNLSQEILRSPSDVYHIPNRISDETDSLHIYGLDDHLMHSA